MRQGVLMQQRVPMMPRNLTPWLAATMALMSVGCGQDASEYGPKGTLDLKTEFPELMPVVDAPPYTGDDPYVLEAQRLHPTGLQLHKNVIVRTCGPTQGVCHNQKEYPDLHATSYFLDSVSAPCNVQPGDWAAVYDGCEQPGDRVSLGDSRKVEIGWMDYINGDSDYDDENIPGLDSPGLHIQLQSAIDIGDGRSRTWGRATFHRSEVDDGNVVELSGEQLETEWFLLEGGTHLVGEVPGYRADQVAALMDSSISQGDMNRNGVYGARSATPLSMLKAGAPEESYLIGRLRGELSGEVIPGTRMPLANEPLTIADMLALFCLVEGLPTTMDGIYDLNSPINYQDCSYSSDPEGLNLLGNGATWLGRVQPLLVANCQGCHGAEAPLGEFDVVSEGLYERLLGTSTQVDMPFITPGEPAQSYLWQKLTAAEGIVGLAMPLDAELQPRVLPEGALADIETWILNGAAAEE